MALSTYLHFSCMGQGSDQPLCLVLNIQHEVKCHGHLSRTLPACSSIQLGKGLNKQVDPEKIQPPATLPLRKKPIN